MTIAAPIITPLFATPFAVVAGGAPAELHAELASLFVSRATDEYRDASLPGDPVCFRSREDIFEWQSEPVALLRRLMLGGVCAAVMGMNRCTEAEFNALRVQARARFALVRADGCIAAATSPMASWNCLYCIAAPPLAPSRADSAVLRLYGVRDATMFMDASNWQLRAPFAGGHHLWRPVPGEMAVFPASVLHEIALNRSEENLLLVIARIRFAHAGQTAVPSW